MSGLSEMLVALGRAGGGGMSIVNHLAHHGPSSADDLADATGYTRCGARAALVALHAAGVIELEDLMYRRMVGVRRNRYYLEPDALRYTARWLDSLADRAVQANRAAAYVPVPKGRSR